MVGGGWWLAVVVVGGGRWWWVVVGGSWRPWEATEAAPRAQILAWPPISSSSPTLVGPLKPKATLVLGGK